MKRVSVVGLTCALWGWSAPKAQAQWEPIQPWLADCPYSSKVYKDYVDGKTVASEGGEGEWIPRWYAFPQWGPRSNAPQGLAVSMSQNGKVRSRWKWVGSGKPPRKVLFKL